MGQINRKEMPTEFTNVVLKKGKKNKAVKLGCFKKKWTTKID